MRAVLVFPRASPRLVAQHVRPDDHVVAIDGGAEALLAAGRAPTRLVGDMDSIKESTIREMVRLGVPIERHPPHKRDTDAALALRALPDADEILFLGPGGGRADHALANLHLLAEAALRARAWAVDDDAETFVATPTRPLDLALPLGATASMIPFDARVDGIRYEGFRYPLHDATMLAGDPYGMSNVAEAPRQRIEVRAGRLLVLRPLQSV